MPENGVSVDIRSIADFRETLVARLAEADVAVRRIAALAGHQARLGTFADAVRIEESYATLSAGYRQRVDRLRAAVIAVQRATDTVIANYHGTEERNRISAGDLAAQLGDVTTAVDEDAGRA